MKKKKEEKKNKKKKRRKKKKKNENEKKEEKKMKKISNLHYRKIHAVYNLKKNDKVVSKNRTCTIRPFACLGNNCITIAVSRRVDLSSDKDTALLG
ncbi:hypothetical protein J6590_015974 [Homalodisca vitripennis]|nr:hypothetical protein J6590_015974 [Homalodisca vitripennis]